MEFKYKNIAISGSVAVGSTSLMRQLQPILEPEGFVFQSTGQLFRERIKDSGVNEHNPHAGLATEEAHRDVEKKVHDLLEAGEKYVIEGWLAGFTARDIDHTLRILVILPDMEVRAQRFMDRESVTEEEARQYIQDREAKNLSYWKKMYGEYDFFDPAYFNVVIDTTHTTQEEARDIVLNEFTA